jgi:NAD(P)-dependent dehydrogenase (short-subunit alcohol dehydrogenase family)
MSLAEQNTNEAPHGFAAGRQRALVTGSTAGIGYAIAEGLAQEGAEVIVNGRSAERVVEAVGAINNSTSTRAIGIAADLRSAAGVTRLVKEVGRVDILVNNVGVFAPVPFTDISDEAWQEIFDINVMSGVRLSRALVHGMVERKWGRIIFISSESGVQIPAEMVHYGVTKTAQLALSRGIAESVAGTGVTVNAVLPGPTRSEGVEEFVGKLADNQGADLADFKRDFVKTMRPSSLIGRLAETKEVANLVVFLCGEGSAAITGASLRVDGGVVRSIV